MEVREVDAICPHEYIVRDKCPLTDGEFVYFIDMQRRFGVKERWGKYNNPYLYIDDYKYWTMGAPMEETTVINRAKACVVDDAHKLYQGMKEAKGNEYIDEYIHKKLGLKPRNKGYNINLLSGRLDELEACVSHLRRIRKNYCSEVMKKWSQRLSEDFPRRNPLFQPLKSWSRNWTAKDVPNLTVLGKAIKKLKWRKSKVKGTRGYYLRLKKQ